MMVIYVFDDLQMATVGNNIYTMIYTIYTMIYNIYTMIYNIYNMICTKINSCLDPRWHMNHFFSESTILVQRNPYSNFICIFSE